jgi:hypothetical protein
LLDGVLVTVFVFPRIALQHLNVFLSLILLIFDSGFVFIDNLLMLATRRFFFFAQS